MTLPRLFVRSQARLARRQAKTGRAFTLTFAGPWTRSPMNGFVLRPPLGTLGVKGTLSFGGSTGGNVSDLKKEKIEKWGKLWTPDGDALLPMSVLQTATTDTIVQITDTTPGGCVYDVLYVPPPAMVENTTLMAWVRLQPVYNKLVQVKQADEIDGGETLILANLPCRLAPQEFAMAQNDELGSVLEASLVMDCPFVVAADGVTGAGIAPAPAGSRFFFTPKSTLVVDDPAAYGQGGVVETWRVASVPIDPGGDGHHLRYTLTRA